MEILTAFIIGLVGSFHCIGMCGPIALALPVPNSGNISFFIGRVIYNLGRIISYSMMGLLFGFIGEKIIISGFQQWLSIILGCSILLYFILPYRYKNKITNLNVIRKILSFLKIKISSLFKEKKNISFLAIGFLNGFLPCGFVYIGLAGATSTGNLVSGMIFMTLFGLGTFPAMLAVSIFGKFIGKNFRQKLSRLTPVFAAVIALLLIVRGMNLGIPYLSPELNKTNQTHEMMCH